ncbi:MAG: hypothetical protein NT067_06755 [Candidatus Diapherotrites archaeon]|nr:hypothetical protein [Candidatus Diapherotrites archaeon]
MDLVLTAAIIGIAGFSGIYAWFLWRSGRLDSLIARFRDMPAKKTQEHGLEFIKLPDIGENIKGSQNEIELIHFKGKNGLELLIPPPLKDVIEKKEKALSIKPRATLLTGKNLTGYFLLLTRLLAVMDKKPVFLVIKEMDIERFRQYSNVTVSIFKQKSPIEEEIKTLQFQYMKGIITEQEFKKKMSVLQIQRERQPLTSRLYEGYTYFSSPSEILKDIGWFLLKTDGKGLIVMTMIDEMLQQNPKKAKTFIENLLRACTNHSTPVIFTLEQGFFSEETNSILRSYCDMVMETTLESGRRNVTVYALEKVHPLTRVSEALSSYEKFLKNVGFLEEK